MLYYTDGTSVFRQGTNMIRAGWAVLTAGSDVSFVVTLAVLGPQSSSVGVHSWMHGRHLQCSGMLFRCLLCSGTHEASLSGCTLECSSGVFLWWESSRGPQAARASSCLARLPALYNQGRSGVKLDTPCKGGLGTGSAGVTRNAPWGGLWKLWWISLGDGAFGCWCIFFAGEAPWAGIYFGLLHW